MLRVSVKGLDAIKEKMQRIATGLRPQIEEELLRITLSAHSYAVRLASGSVIKVRSGFTRKSIKWAFAKKTLTGRIGSRKKHMRQIEHGGTITPKRGKYLTIPMPAAQTASGVTRKPITDYEGFFLRTKEGWLFFFEDKGDGKIKPMFMLVRSVTQKPKKLFELTLEKVRPEAIKGMDTVVRKTISEVFG